MEQHKPKLGTLLHSEIASYWVLPNATRTSTNSISYSHSIVSNRLKQMPFFFLPGVVALVRHLHSHGIPIAVATSSSSKSYNVKISKKSDFFSLFSHFVCSDDKEMKRGKPAPDIYLIAASRFSNPPQSNANVSLYVSTYLPTNHLDYECYNRDK